VKLAVLVAGLLVMSSVAVAQSKKYPPIPVDKDLEAEQKSKVWESALSPELQKYEGIIAGAEGPLRDTRPERWRAAIGELDRAIALQPKRHEAYQLRAMGYDKLKDFAKCAKDLETAEGLAPRNPDEPRVVHRQRLGFCQARSGNLHAAERTLANLASAGSRDGETWMRLGEVRIALGKLDEAITALQFAAENTDNPPAMARWLLALAYDRARMPSQAADALELARGRDPSFSTLTSASATFLGTADGDYLLGLAWGVSGVPRPDLQMIYFQKFLKTAGDSPWRKRAEEHLKALRSVQLPERRESISRNGGAALDMDVAYQLVKKGMPAMRQCLAKAPGTILKVTVTRTGPRTPTPPTTLPRDPWDRGARRPISAPPPAGVTILTDQNVMEASKVAIDDAVRCIEPLADKLKWPAIKDKDTYYGVVFFVVGP